MKIKTIKVGYLKTNCYILIINNDCLIIDPGDDLELINKELENLNVLAILITHHHFDHVGCLDNLLNKYKCKLIDVKSYKNSNSETIIKDFKFKIITTPGHKEDSVTFYFEKENIMFTGDFLFKDTIGRCDLDGSNIIDMEKSIKKIKEYNSNITIYPGHGNTTNLGYEKDNNIYFKDGVK